MNTLEAIEYLAEPSNYSSDGKLITPNWNHIEPFEFAQKVLSKMDVFMKDVITQEIEWCEENHGMKSKEFEDGFIAGLKQVIFLVEAAQSGLTSRAVDKSQPSLL